MTVPTNPEPAPTGVCGYESNGDPIGPHDTTGQGRCGCGPGLCGSCDAGLPMSCTCPPAAASATTADDPGEDVRDPDLLRLEIQIRNNALRSLMAEVLRLRDERDEARAALAARDAELRQLREQNEAWERLVDGADKTAEAYAVALADLRRLREVFDREHVCEGGCDPNTCVEAS